LTAPKALVVCGDGINCEAETSHALSLVGFDVQSMHVTELLASPQKLQEAKLLCVPGGFSFGDEIASGKVLALKIRQHMREQLQTFIEKKRLVVGICNGFQVLVQLGLLPFPEINAARVVSLTHNRQHRFINRWVSLQVSKTSASDVFFKSLDRLDLPMRHGEGNLKLEVNASQSQNKDQENLLASVKAHASLRYVEDVNGSVDRIAALSSTDGTVMGLMPHPEAFVRFTQHPRWTNRDWHEKVSVNGGKPPGLVIFENAFAYVSAASN
jgi:phosphoribosylformylglycinamidine (FGAM) synthase-like amidotransferase family enzyme